MQCFNNIEVAEIKRFVPLRYQERVVWTWLFTVEKTDGQ